MTGIALFLVTGFLLGMRHATDADHVVAVSTIVARERSVRAAAGAGALWGIGHTATVATAGGAIVAFQWTVTPSISLSLELCVAAMLIALGALNLAPARASTAQARSWRPVAVGAVHGLAGSAAVALLIVPLTTGLAHAALYLAVFGAGTIAGMAAVTVALAAPAAMAGARLGRLDRGIRLVSGWLSVGFGCWLAIETVVSRGGTVAG